MANNEVNEVALLSELQPALEDVVKLLKSEGLAFTHPSLRYALEMVDEAFEADPEDLLRDAKARNLLRHNVLGSYAGRDSFGDLGLWREDTAERLKVNRELQILRDRLYALAKQL